MVIIEKTCKEWIMASYELAAVEREKIWAELRCSGFTDGKW